MRIRDILSEMQPGWTTGVPKRPAGYSDEFLDCLELYLEGHGLWHERNTAKAARIDQAFQAEMPQLPPQMPMLYRGWSPDSLADIPAESDFINNDVVSFPWYISTTEDEEEAQTYLTHSGTGASIMLDSPNIMLSILPKSGARGIRLRDFRDRNRKLLFLERWSEEVILDRKARYKVWYRSDQNNPDSEAEGHYDQYAEWRERGLEVWEVQLEQVD